MDNKIEQLDKISQDILKALLLYGPTSARQLAKKIPYSHQTIATKIKRLKERGIIKDFLILPNLHKLGYVVSEIHIKLGKVDKEKVTETLRTLALEPQVLYIAECAGAYDFIFSVAAQGIEGLHDTQYRIREFLTKELDIKRWDTFIVTREVKNKISAKLIGGDIDEDTVLRRSKRSR